MHKSDFRNTSVNKAQWAGGGTEGETDDEKRRRWDGSTCRSRSRAVLAERSQRGHRSHSRKAVEEERRHLGLQWASAGVSLQQKINKREFQLKI